MKFQLVLTHAHRPGVTAETEFNEVTDSEFDEYKTMIKENLNVITYLEIGNKIYPGDLIRNSFIISFNTAE